MKTKINYLFSVILFALLAFTSCQDEVNDIENPDDQETIVPNSSLANLMSNVVTNNGAIDDFLDNSSCFSVELPVTIVVSDITIIIETEADLEDLEDLLDNVSVDEDALDFIFPITIVYNNYEEVVIANTDQLQAFIDECINEDDDDIIECADFVYPVSFSVFNSDFNLVETIVIENDETLYDFLDELEDDENALIVSLNFPVSIIYANGEIIEVNSNEELSAAIENAEQFCDNENDECLEDELAFSLIECPWDVYLYTNNDLENLDGPLSFAFSDDGNVIVSGIFPDPYITTWELNTTDNGLVLHIESLYYYEAQLGNWLVVECDDDNISLEYLSIEGTGMFLEQNCDDDLDCSISDISNILQECPWDFSDGTGNFQNHQLIFNDNGELLISEGIATSAIGGNWSLESSDNGIVLTFSELTAFQNVLGGDWLITECDEDDIVISRANQTIVLEQDCIGDLDCSEDEIYINLLECAWELQSNLFDSLVPFYLYFMQNGGVFNANNDIPESQIGTWELITVGSDIYMELNLYQGFENLSGQWQIVECVDDMLYLVNDNNFISLSQDCDLQNDEILFNCFGDFEIVECTQPNNIPIYNLSANTIGLVDCSGSFLPSFHVTLADAESNVNPIANTEAYATLESQVYLRIEAESGNFEVYTIYLNTEDCNYFECFESFDAVIEVCDNGTDGPYEFNLPVAFSNCTPSADNVTYYVTLSDADIGVNAIANPSSFNTVDINSTVFVRVEINNQTEIFPIQLNVISCNIGSCTEGNIDGILTECIWNVTNYNGSDNLSDYNFHFEESTGVVVIYNASNTIDANWSTSQPNDTVIIEFSNVAGPNIQAVNGSWYVVECTASQLVLHNINDSSNEIVLDSTCE
ncbi:hypothetical protein [Winogradskyella sp. 4-2091]|uniref:hypothetical protein n=1 Tax=Winogradskyella sp. 4-2091 TaxID=3381659 RepID=UPI0038923ABC